MLLETYTFGDLKIAITIGRKRSLRSLSNQLEEAVGPAGSGLRSDRLPDP